jgi:type III secretion protein V
VKRFNNIGDIFLALLVFAVVIMLLIPVPTPIIDLLITCNLAFSFLLLLSGVYLTNPHSLLIFPSMLLLTTLLRLGLNVASTRLILSQGYAGRVIEAFGKYLLGEQVVVGILIFIIITIVNFIVIAKGSARVSEVAARFVLDALPGKQMAIDADLRSGNITQEQARRKREELRQESELYGSMDGAMKFVQGDAIAGAFIILVNIIGGIYIGLQNGLEISEAVRTYTILTVGDGLVTQIPALLISICAGIVVTRVFSDDKSTLGADLSLQLLSKREIMMLTGMMIVFVGFLPGLPWIPFVGVGLFFVAFSFVPRFFITSAERSGIAPQSMLDYAINTGLRNVTKGKEFEEEQDELPVELYLDQSVLYKQFRTNGSKETGYKDFWKEFQVYTYENFGINLPKLRVYADEKLPPSSFRVYFKGVLIKEGRGFPDELYVCMCPEVGQTLGLSVKKIAEDIVTGYRTFWTQNTRSHKLILKELMTNSYDVIEYIFYRLYAFFIRNPEEVLSLSDIHLTIKSIEKKYPGLVNENLNKNVIDVSKITEILHWMVKDGISIKEVKQIIEVLAAYSSQYKQQLQEDNAIDLAHILGYLRRIKKRSILSNILGARIYAALDTEQDYSAKEIFHKVENQARERRIKAILLSEDVEYAFEEASIDNFYNIFLEPGIEQTIKNKITEILTRIKHSGVLPVVILCKPEVRSRASSFLKNIGIYDSVLSFEEIESNVEVVQVGVW